MVMDADLDDVMRQTAAANWILADVGLAVGLRSALGHASKRLPSDPIRFVVKGREYEVDALSVMRPEDMVICDTEGYKVGRPHRTDPVLRDQDTFLYLQDPTRRSIGGSRSPTLRHLNDRSGRAPGTHVPGGCGVGAKSHLGISPHENHRHRRRRDGASQPHGVGTR